MEYSELWNRAGELAFSKRLFAKAIWSKKKPGPKGLRWSTVEERLDLAIEIDGVCDQVPKAQIFHSVF